MKKSDVEIGATYLVKVAGNLVPLRITKKHESGADGKFRTVYVKRWWLRLFDRLFGVDCFGAAFRYRGRGLSTCDAGF